MGRIFLFLLFTAQVSAAAGNAPACEPLILKSEQAHNIPAGLLKAIAHTESGRGDGAGGIRAWPWAANVEGTAKYYDTRDAAVNALQKVLDGGNASFDVGCMQLNWYWHGSHFNDIAAMIDPAENVAYAARYLAELHRETGSWVTATRYYHSRDAARGQAYGARVAAAWTDVTPTATAPRALTFASPAKSASGNESDRRFERAAPLVHLGTHNAYWTHSNLGEGQLPRF